MAARAAPRGFGPGKTTPRFLEDLHVYRPTTSHNSLTDIPPHYNAPQPKVDHRHNLVIVDELSNLQSTGTDPQTLATVCESCQAHIELEIHRTAPGLLEADLCPQADYQLHHLQHDPTKSKITHHDGTASGRETHTEYFACSAPSCPLSVAVTYKPALLNIRLQKMLTDYNTLRQRLVKACQRLGQEVPANTTDLAWNTLQALEQCLRNVLAGDQRSVPRKNPRYLKRLSDECIEIFHIAHFTEELNPDNTLVWLPPPKEALEDKSSNVRRDVEELYQEVVILNDRHKGSNPPIRKSVTRAENKLKELLACKDYGALSPWGSDLAVPEHPAYAALGAVVDFPDTLLLWAFTRQQLCDPDRSPYYFECLKVLAGGRKSENLQVQVSLLASQGEFTQEDVFEAARALGIPDIDNSTDDLIVGIFKARLQDAPKQEVQLRDSLRILGRYRKSELILSTARKAFTNVEGAYNWLGIPNTTDDQFIISTYEVRIKDCPADEATAKEALRMIAEDRQSPVLLTFLETGGVYEQPDMDAAAAYAKLDIPDRTLPDDVIINVFNVRLTDAPGQLTELRNALRVIGEDRKSTKIADFLRNGQGESSVTQDGARKPDEPVGLENIGNTCYLNSLLQFYFTIKPLRDMILNIEQYQEAEITDEVVERKRVGGRKVSKAEIERAKKFVEHLRVLFGDMINTRSSSVTPERDLAYLALVSSKDEAERRNSVANDKPALIDLTEDAMDIDPLLSDTPAVDKVVPRSNASDRTLVNEPGEDLPPPYDAPSEDYVMVDSRLDGKPDDKENLSGPVNAEQSTDIERIPLKEVDPQPMEQDHVVYGPPPLTPPPDEAPPPVPPRPVVKTTGPDINLMFGRQQDVTECIGNVMFQIEAAIKPQSIDEEQNGEQEDLVKDYFYGKTKQTLKFPDSAEERTKEELFSHLLVNVADGDRDLYSALDASFDAEQVELEGKQANRYLSITRLPPILQIQVQRVQFDRAKGSAYKSNSLLTFPETIFMDRYLDTDDDGLKTRREEAWKWKEELRTLLKRKEELTQTPINEDIPTVLDTTREFLEDLSSIDPSLAVSPDVTAALEHRASAVTRELATIDDKLKDLNSRINQQYTDLRKHPYRIHSVFIHRGSVSFGHYWIYIYDFQKGVFRKYNDQYVTQVDDVKEVFTHSGNNAPTPYFLVFVREDQSLTITEAVQRVQEMEEVAKVKAAKTEAGKEA